MAKSTAYKGESGAVFVMLLFALPLLVGVVLTVYQTAVLMRERARMQELADVAALQAAAIQARGLNALAVLNDVLLGVEGLAAGIVLNGNGLALGLDALLVTAPEGIELHKVSFETMNQLRDLSTQVAGLQDLAVQVLAFAPMAGAQLPLLFDSFKPMPVILAYPLPGLDAGLRAAPPLSARGLQFKNLFAAVTDEALGVAGDIFGPLDDELRGIAKKECKLATSRPVSTLTGFLSDPLGRRNKKKAKKKPSGGNLSTDDITAVCEKLRELAKSKGSIVQKQLSGLFDFDSHTQGLGGGQEDIAGFSQPLLLDTNYAPTYQVAALVARCSPLVACPSVKLSNQFYAIAQARAFSRRQPAGGDLLIPDFRATLVPVTVFDSVTSNLPSGPWSILH